MTVIANNYPSTGKCTFWTSTISPSVDAATPVATNVEITFPESRSPYPLNVAPLTVSRIFTGPESRTFVVFTNGEIHEVDLSGRQFKYLYSIIPDEDQLSVSHPSATWGHAWDADRRLVWSVIMGGSDAFFVSHSLDTKTGKYFQYLPP